MIIKELFKLLNIAIKKECVPVSSIIVRNNKVVSRSYNLKEKSHNPLDHAEIICIKKAAHKLKTWKLEDCELYVTMKPCKMCESVINECRIKKVYYLCDNNKEENKKTMFKVIKINDKINELKYIELLRKFFKIKRN